MRGCAAARCTCVRGARRAERLEPVGGALLASLVAPGMRARSAPRCCTAVERGRRSLCWSGCDGVVGALEGGGGRECRGGAAVVGRVERGDAGGDTPVQLKQL